MTAKKPNILFSERLVTFTLPQLHKGKTWYVDFYAFDPSRDSMRRKKYMLDRYKHEKERLTMAALAIHNITQRLIAGWNPFVNAEKSRHFTDFAVVLERYKAYVEKAGDNGVMKAKTVTDYLSRVRQLELYMRESGNIIKYVYQFDKVFATDFLDYLIYDKDVSTNTRNNYRTWLSTFGTWLKDRLYRDDNPIEDIRMLREKEKKREALTQQQLVALGDYCRKYNPQFYLACMMEYYTFIRPDELRHIKVGDISITEQSVYVNSEVSKNRKGQSVALNDKVIKLMIEQHVFDHPSSDYLFGKDMKPGEDMLYVNRFRLEWAKVRKALNWSSALQFYSLKDSGIRDLANAEGIVVARDQARHSDVAVTNRYLKPTKVVHQETKHFDGAL